MSRPTIYRRDPSGCCHKQNGRRYHRCDCSVWVQGSLSGEYVRESLRLRGGPGTDFETHKVLAPGSQVRILLTQGEWSQVDTTGDDQADGFVYSAYLKPVAV
jgi:hypothetical protein